MCCGASTWEKGLVSSVCTHAELFHVYGTLYSSVYFLYISWVFYVMNIAFLMSSIYGVTMVVSIVSESEDTFHNAVSSSLS